MATRRSFGHKSWQERALPAPLLPTHDTHNSKMTSGGAAEDWQTGKNLPQTNLHMLENQIACDVTFTVQSGESTVEIPAHKFILMSRSPVFERMLTSDFREQETGSVQITDISPPDFKELLRFMYTESASLTEKNVLQLRYAATKYMLHKLAKECVTYVEKKMDCNNVCTILDNSLHYKDKETAQRCLNFTTNNARQVLKTTGFYHLSNQALKLILQLDGLKISGEHEVLDACKTWARTQHQGYKITDEVTRETLGECLYQIRFADFEATSFSKYIGMSGILEDKEFRLFNIYITDRDEKVKEKLASLGFNMQTREAFQKYLPYYG